MLIQNVKPYYFNNTAIQNTAAKETARGSKSTGSARLMSYPANYYASFGLGRPLLDEQQAKIIEMHRQGKTLAETAEETGHAVSTIQRILKKHGESAVQIYRKPPKKFTDEERAEIIEYRKNGGSQAEIAKKFDCTQAAVSRILIESGEMQNLPASIRRTKPKKLTEEDKQQIIDIFRQTKSQAETARRTGLQDGAVNYILMKCGEITTPQTASLEEHKDEVIDMYMNCRPIQEIAEKYGVHAAAVSAMLSSNGVIELRQNLEEQQKKEHIIELYNQGQHPAYYYKKEFVEKTISEYKAEQSKKILAELTEDIKQGKFPPAAVGDKLRKYPLEDVIRAANDIPKILPESALGDYEIIRLYKEGRKKYEIALELDCSLKKVNDVIKNWEKIKRAEAEEYQKRETKHNEAAEAEKAVPGLTIEDLKLSSRTKYCLSRAGIKSLDDLLKKSGHDLLKIRHFGRLSYNEVIEKLHQSGLELQPDSEEQN